MVSTRVAEKKDQHSAVLGAGGSNAERTERNLVSAGGGHATTTRTVKKSSNGRNQPITASLFWKLLIFYIYYIWCKISALLYQKQAKLP